METELFSTDTREGKMLYVAVANLMQSSGKEAAEVVQELEQAAELLENFKM